MNALTWGLIMLVMKFKSLLWQLPSTPHFPEAFGSEYWKHKYSHVHVQTELNPIKALSCLLKSKNYNLDEFYNSEFNRKLIDILSSDFDVVVLTHFTQVLPSTVRKCSNAKVVYRAHNVESEIWDGLA